MFIAKFLRGPMDGRHMELQTLELTIHVEMRIYTGVDSADDDVSFHTGTYIREATPSRIKTDGSKTPYTYVWDGFHE